MVLSDYYLFADLTNIFRGKRFDFNEDVITVDEVRGVLLLKESILVNKVNF